MISAQPLAPVSAFAFFRAEHEIMQERRDKGEAGGTPRCEAPAPAVTECPSAQLKLTTLSPAEAALCASENSRPPLSTGMDSTDVHRAYQRLSESEKAKYVALAQTDRLRFERETLQIKLAARASAPAVNDILFAGQQRDLGPRSGPLQTRTSALPQHPPQWPSDSQSQSQPSQQSPPQSQSQSQPDPQPVSPLPPTQVQEYPPHFLPLLPPPPPPPPLHTQSVPQRQGRPPSGQVWDSARGGWTDADPHIASCRELARFAAEAAEAADDAPHHGPVKNKTKRLNAIDVFVSHCARRHSDTADSAGESFSEQSEAQDASLGRATSKGSKGWWLKGVHAKWEAMSAAEREPYERECQERIAALQAQKRADLRAHIVAVATATTQQGVAQRAGLPIALQPTEQTAQGMVSNPAAAPAAVAPKPKINKLSRAGGFWHTAITSQQQVAEDGTCVVLCPREAATAGEGRVGQVNKDTPAGTSSPVSAEDSCAAAGTCTMRIFPIRVSACDLQSKPRIKRNCQTPAAEVDASGSDESANDSAGASASASASTSASVNATANASSSSRNRTDKGKESGVKRAPTGSADSAGRKRRRRRGTVTFNKMAPPGSVCAFFCPDPTCQFYSDQFFLQKKALQEHYNTCHAPKLLKCPLPHCNKQYATIKALRAHLRMCGAPQVLCSCGAKLSSITAARKHASKAEAEAKANGRAPRCALNLFTLEQCRAHHNARSAQMSDLEQQAISQSQDGMLGEV